MGSAWNDLDVVGNDGRYTATISDVWDLAVVPQGGVIAATAVRAMEAELGDPTQSLRTLSVMFAGQVASGALEIDVRLLRRGRSMSQLTADVRTVGADAGLFAVAAFGGSRRGFEFTDLEFPDVPGPDGRPSFRDGPPEGVEFEFSRPPMPFWERVLESRPVIGRAPWEEFVDGPAEVAYWYRFDDPPLGPDGMLATIGPVVMCDTMPGSVSQKIGQVDETWFAPSVDYTLHVFRPARPGWLLAHMRARHAGDGYASVDCALWDGEDRSLVAYATQVMVFSFAR